MFDKWNYELEDPKKPVSLSTLAELYYQVKSHSILSKELETTNMDQKLISSPE